LLGFGLGSNVGLTVAGFAMTSFGAASPFAITGTAHIMLILFALSQRRYAPAVAEENKVAFKANPLARASTPETAALGADQAELEANRATPPPPDTEAPLADTKG
jgi:hypothetical protein